MPRMTVPDEIRRQYEALTAGAGLADLADRTLIEVTGGDRITFINAFCTNDVKRLAEGQGCEAFILNPQGKTIGHAFVFHRGGSLLIDGAAGQSQALIKHWDKYVISEDVAFRDLSTGETDMLLAGQLAAEVLEKLGLPPLTGVACALGEIAGRPVVIKQVDYAGPMSFLIQTARDSAAEIASALTAAGAVPCNSAAVEMARIERGTPLFGREISEDNLPQEIGRDAQAISFKKGCYLGQETVARIDALGHVNRLLVGLKLAGPTPAVGAAVLAAEKEVGRITSVAQSPKLEGSLALALVRRAQAKAGTTLTVDSSPATVVPLPA